MAGDRGGNETGSYLLFIQRTNNPTAPTPIICNDMLPGTITLFLQMQSYTFSGTAGDQVLVRMSESVNTGFDPEFRIYRPDGTLLCSVWDSDTNGTVEKLCLLDTTGTHIILAGDFDGNETGNYTLSLSLSGPSCPTPPDLALTKTDSPGPVIIGNLLTYLLDRRQHRLNSGHRSNAR